jgi:TPR repeat protein
MNPRALLSFLVVSILTSISFAQTQNPQTAPPASPSSSQLENERKQLLARAETGDRSAQMWVGVLYEQGRGGPRDFQEALKWFRKAAAQGDPDAQVFLGQMYADGEGVKQNYAVAAKWYRKAADHVPVLGGAGQGRNELGLLYLQGLGVPRDYVRAYMWFSLTGDQTNLPDAKAEMTPVQILQAERLVQEWKERHPSP